MKKVVAVIGMNFGDEGKGHITNYVSNEKTLNVRFNGGCQAAHSVFMDDGRDHIFHQFGSGTLKGARTLFASHFIVNPIVFVAEAEALSKITKLREVFIDPRCRVSTPYDMLLNEFSCWIRKKTDTTGFGINETVERSQYKQLKITAKDIFEGDITNTLKLIRTEWVPYRVGDKLSLFKEFMDTRVWSAERLEQVFIDTIKVMSKFVVLYRDSSLMDLFLQKETDRNVVFEGAQGLLLDQNRKEFFPYLTRSSTGIQNVCELLRASKTVLDFEIILVTRAYLTRHGDGPLWNERLAIYKNINNLTNPENPYQGKLRYGYLNWDWYNTALLETRKKAKELITSIPTNVGTAITCVDHLDSDHILCSPKEYNIPYKSLEKRVINDFQSVKIISNGPTESSIKKVV